jgi:hypothetical protein
MVNLAVIDDPKEFAKLLFKAGRNRPRGFAAPHACATRPRRS